MGPCGGLSYQDAGPTPLGPIRSDSRSIGSAFAGVRLRYGAEGTTPKDRVLVSLLYQPRLGGGSFMISSGKGRRADRRTLCDRALERAEVIGTPVASEAFSMVDALWLTEPRMEAVRALDDVVQAQV